MLLSSLECTCVGVCNRIDMQDGIGNRTWDNDDLHRPTAVTDLFGGSVGHSYDPAYQLTQMID
ncbi:MAG TPA: RHS repeat domain-containing protein [Anaerolineales bacterium]|nr:RHS repeat domain-containing protein [Anaerolineales bacterium]